jgi:hypothetical protein
LWIEVCWYGFKNGEGILDRGEPLGRREEYALDLYPIDRMSRLNKEEERE